MSKMSYNAEEIANAIVSSMNLVEQVNTAKGNALNILSSLNPPQGLDISSEVSVLREKINMVSERAVEIKSKIESVRSKIESMDASLHQTISVFISNKLVYGAYINGENRYGGNQGAPFMIVDTFEDTTYCDIIKSYYPEMTDNQVLDYLQAINNVGCGYTAIANYIMQAYASKPNEFEEKFGFPMYSKDEKGNIVANTNYLLTDVYCYANKTGIVDYYKKIEVDEESDIAQTSDKTDYIEYIKDMLFFNFDDGLSYPGSSDRAPGVVRGDIINILESDRYKDANIKLEPIKKYNDYFESNASFVDTVKKYTDEGKVINLGARDYDLYLADEDGNIMKDKDGNDILKYTVVDGPHAMTITDVNADGDYVVSTWGDKYVLDVNSLDEYTELYLVNIN